MNPTGWICPRRVGFLFPHACDRLSPIGCPDCQNGQIADPYAQRTDRYGYTDYDRYDDGSDFTEADGEHLIKRRAAFEDDMSAS